MSGLTLDAADSALSLAPGPLSPTLLHWTPGEPVTGAQGVQYRVDRNAHRLLMKRACDSDFIRLGNLGGRGFATGRFNRPASVAVDAHGRLYIADTGNARVQIILPDSGEVLAVLDDSLASPVHVAITRSGTIMIADAGTKLIHRFDTRFAALDPLPLRTLDPWTEAAWTEPPAAGPRGIAALADGSIAVFDPSRTMLWHMRETGEPLAALPWPDDAHLPPGWQPLPRHFAPRGEIVLGPIDGGTPRLAWHKVLLDATLPQGTSLRVQSFASDRSDPESIAWAPQAPVPVMEGETRNREGDRLILADRQGWALWKAGRLLRANPVVHRFEATPGGIATIALAANEARILRAGDTVTIESENGDVWTSEIAAIAPTTVSISATGSAAAFAGDGPVVLVERDGRPLPYGPLDLAFLGLDRGMIGLDGLTRDGLPQDLALPYDMACALQPGDIVSLGSDGYLEILDIAHGDVDVTFAALLPVGWGAASLSIATTTRRLLVQGDLPSTAIAPGTVVTVMGDVHAIQAVVEAAAAGTIWLREPLSGHVLADDWVSAQFPVPAASDRGRFLWLRIQFEGAARAPGTGVGYALDATATPVLRAIRIIAPRPNLLDLLPAPYRSGDLTEDAPGANFMERFLSLFEGALTRIEDAYDSVSRLLNPDAADAEWLDFVASWLDLSFDPSWPIVQRRQVVREAAALKAGQGTPRALQRYLEIYTGRPVAIGEGFRRAPARPIQLGARGALGVAPLGAWCTDEDDGADLAHRFSVAVDLPAGEFRLAARSAVLKIIDTMKPAHTHFTLMTRGTLPSRIGIDAQIGEIAIPGQDADPCACDPDPGAAATRSGNVDTGFLIGGRLGRGGSPEFMAMGD